MNDFERDIAAVLNKHGKDTETNTPDFILAEYINRTLMALAGMNTKNKDWHGEDVPTSGVTQ